MFRSAAAARTAARSFYASMSRRCRPMSRQVCERRIAYRAGCVSWGDVLNRIEGGTLEGEPVENGKLVRRLIKSYVRDIEANPLEAFSDDEIVRQVTEYLPAEFAESTFGRIAIGAFSGYCLLLVCERDLRGWDFDKESIAQGFSDFDEIMAMTAPPEDRPKHMRRIPYQAVNAVEAYFAAMPLTEQRGLHDLMASHICAALDRWHVSVDLHDPEPRPKGAFINRQILGLSPVTKTPVASFAAFMAEYDESDRIETTQVPYPDSTSTP